MNQNDAQSEVVRAFVAVPLADDIRDALARAQKRLRWVGAQVAWTPPENLHVTMAFLGYLPAEAGNGVAEALDRAASESVPFDMEVRGLGVFGRPSAPRVVWAGIRDGRDALVALQRRIAEGLAGIGIRLEERAFHPHITLGRVKTPRNAKALLESVEEAKERVYGSQAADRVLLMKSLLMPSGARYIMWHETKLKG